MFLKKIRTQLLADMVHDRAEPDSKSVIQRVSQNRTRENYRLAAQFVTDKNVLDIGPGYGLAYDQLLAADPKKITCIDKFDQSRHHFVFTDDRIQHLGHDFLENDFADHQFDVIICVATMYYLTDHDAFLAEIDRVLAPGGTLIINTFDRSVMRTIFGQTLADMDPENYGPVYDGHEFADLISQKIVGAKTQIQVQSPVRWHPKIFRPLSLLTLPFRLLFSQAKLHPADGAKLKGVYTMLVAAKPPAPAPRDPEIPPHTEN